MTAERETVLVTGSSGLIGAAVCRRLAPAYRVVGLDRPGAPYPPAAVECVDLDVTSDESVRQALAHVRRSCGDRVASVVHLAAYYDFSGAPSDLYEQVTVRGTGRLLAVALTDVLGDGLSMVYSFFDPEFGDRSLGTQMILDHIARANAMGLDYVYLGYWVPNSRKMDYKGRFLPQERLAPSGWARVESEPR